MNNDSLSNKNIQAATFADCLANSKEIFQLIDEVFPLDSCRHYQVLPLKVEGNILTLGILDPSNEESLKFANSIASVYQFKLVLNLIDVQTHEIILSSYPQNSRPQSSPNQDQNQTIVDASFAGGAVPLNEVQRNRRKLADSAPTIISQPKQNLPPAGSSLHPGLADLPADLDFLRDLDLNPSSTAKSPKPRIDPAATLFEIPPEFLDKKPSSRFDDQPTIVGGNPAEMLAQSLLEQESQAQIGSGEIKDLQNVQNSDLLDLDLIAESANQVAQEEQQIKISSVDFLARLQPQLSWQTILESAFKHQTEIINLTRHGDRGNVIAEKDEEIQSTINQLPLPMFSSLIEDIKRMARLPQNTSSHPKKVVLERIYEEERILLRLEFSIEDETEMVIVQILRGQALQIYEQKQMDRISEQALQLAQQLEKTLRKIQVCFDSAQMTNLRELQTVQSRINHQLRLIDKI